MASRSSSDVHKPSSSKRSPPQATHTSFTQMTLVPHPDSVQPPPIVSEPPTVAFVKGGKRKRLSKACDACHKSKRRCDGTVTGMPNFRPGGELTDPVYSYFASKECTYTDSSGRPVPAPRHAHPQLALEHLHQDVNMHPNSNPGAYLPIQTDPSLASGRRQSFAEDPASRVARRMADVNSNPSIKRARPEALAVNVAITAPLAAATSSGVESNHKSPSALLDPSTTHELVNLFFTHCNPSRLIIHKPSFSAALAHEQVPSYLLLAICASAAPLSKEHGVKSSPPRLAGVPFFQEAVSIMFDASGRLLAEPSLCTAQALCLLEMHEVAASHSWTKHYRYFDLALQILEESLQIQKPDHELLNPPLSPGSRTACIERECARRCFWLVQCMGWINGIYTYRPLRPRSVELMKLVRLPSDETSFELVVPIQTSEFMHIPAPRTKYASQFGHLCRILSLYQNLEAVLATKEGSEKAHAVADLRKALEVWVDTLPDHLRFSEDSLEKQISMFETSSNTGAWCYCFIHVLHPCFVLSLIDGEGKQGEPIGWVRNQLNIIFNAIGNRAKNTILCVYHSIHFRPDLSDVSWATAACALWSYSKYQPNDPQLHKWDSDFEKIWGFRVAVVADQWRKCQAEQRSQIGRTYPVDSTSKRETPPSFAVADSSPSPQSTNSPHEPESQQYYPGNDPRGVIIADGSADTHHLQGHNGGFASEVGIGGMHELDPAVSRRDAQSLPSLKASGLLDSWKPPTDAFAHSVTISPRVPRQEEHGRAGIHPSQISSSSNAQQHQAARPGATLPVGLNWLNNEG